MENNSLIDLGYNGAKFTWSNMRGVGGLVLSRHDRGLCNHQWRLIFPEACITHLARAKSDHCPLLLQLDPSAQPQAHLKPFRFETM